MKQGELFPIKEIKSNTEYGTLSLLKEVFQAHGPFLSGWIVGRKTVHEIAFFNSMDSL